MELKKIPDFLDKLPSLYRANFVVFLEQGKTKEEFFPKKIGTLTRTILSKKGQEVSATYENDERRKKLYPNEKRNLEEQKIRKLIEVIKPYLIKKRKQNGKKNLRN